MKAQTHKHFCKLGKVGLRSIFFNTFNPNYFYSVNACEDENTEDELVKVVLSDVMVLLMLHKVVVAMFKANGIVAVEKVFGNFGKVV